jgi:hypothetical protein
MMCEEQSVERLAGETKVLRESFAPSAALSTANTIWHDTGSKRGHRDGKPVTNRLSYSTATTQTVSKLL